MSGTNSNESNEQVLHPVMTTNTAEMLGIKPELYKWVVCLLIMF